MYAIKPTKIDGLTSLTIIMHHTVVYGICTTVQSTMN